MAEHISLLTAEQTRQLDVDGYITIEGVLSPEECGYWSELTDALWLEDRFRPHKYREEPGVRFVRNLLERSVVFERFIADDVVLAAVRRILGPAVLFSLINARRTEPGYGNQPLHDLKRRRGQPFQLCDVIWCLDDFTALNGTRVLPGSHLADERFLARMADPAAPHPDQRIIEAPRGSVFVFNAALIHAGNTNTSPVPRRSVQTQFVRLGRQTALDWHQLPDRIKRGLRPQSRDLLGLTVS